MVVGGGGGLEQFSVSPRPLGFGFGTKGFWAKGLGPGLDKSWETEPKSEGRYEHILGLLRVLTS